LDISIIKKSVENKKWRITNHALKRCDERNLDVEELIAILTEGEIIEDYPDDPRGPSCLILCNTYEKNFLHVVCGIDRDGWLVIITAYHPEEPKWIDERTRRR
jgi:hypothetical protein